MEVYRRTSNNSLFEYDDILIEILVRLPMKVRVLCKAVCKHWFSLISSTWFAKRILSRENNPPWDFLCKSRYLNRLHVVFGRYPELNSQNLKLDSLSMNQNIELLGADNGLILLAKCDEFYSNHSEYYVCNPITGQLVSLPKPQIHEHVLVGFRVCCNDGITTYKVVRAIHITSIYNIYNIEVFSSDVGEWRSTGVSCPRFSHCICNGTVAFKGLIHWYCGVSGRITTYDPDNNKLGFIDMPSNLHYPAYGRISISCGHLCYIHNDMHDQREKKKEIFSIWVLNDYDMKEWRLVLETTVENVFVINQIPLYISFDQYSFVFHPFDLDLVYLEAPFGMEASFGKMASLNLQTQELKCVVKENFVPGLFCDTVYPYVIPPLPTRVPQPIWETD